MYFRQIEDPYLAQYAYLIGCQATGEALLIDPERDIDRYIEIAARNNLRIVAIAETHIHADFVSGAREFAQNYPVKVYLSAEGGTDWQYQWEAIAPARIVPIRHGDMFHIGGIEIEAVHTPGHTPEHLCYLITDRATGADDPMGIISGDFVLVGDVGRPDLLETAAGMVGTKEHSARKLYRSLLEFFPLPDYMHMWPGHGAGSMCGKALGAMPDSTIGYERRYNKSLLAAQDGEEHFVREILHGQPEPPVYFEQMKHWNKQGPPLLPAEYKLPSLHASRLPFLSEDPNTVIIDSRLERVDFFNGHIPNSLWIPLTKSFPTTAGSLIAKDQKIVLICYDLQAELAVRLLWRVGRDNILGYVSVSNYEKWVKYAKPDLSKLAATTFSNVIQRPNNELLLDVRTESEFDEGHLPDAICIPHTRILTKVTELPQDRSIAVHCAAGGRSTAVASLLARMGYHTLAIDENIDAAASYFVRDNAKNKIVA